MMDLIAKVFGQASEGSIPDGRASVSDCLVHLAAAAIAEYIVGNSPVGVELAHLAKALENDADPSVRAMNLGTRMQIRMALAHINKLKEPPHA